MRTTIVALSFSLAALASAYAQPAPRTSPPVSRIPGNGGGSVYSAATAGEFAQACKSDQSSCSAMVGEVLMDRMQFVPTSHICLSGLSYADAVPSWLAAHPRVAAMPVREGIYLALTDLYKCGPPNNY